MTQYTARALYPALAVAAVFTACVPAQAASPLPKILPVTPMAPVAAAAGIPDGVSPVDPERLAIASEVINSGFPVGDREQTFFGAIDAMIAQLRTVHMAQIQNDPGAAAIVNRKLDSFVSRAKDILRTHIPGLMEAMAHAYAREFSKDELVQLRAFALTAAGKHFFLRSSTILRDPDFAAANLAYARDLQPGIAQMRDELTAELKTYFMAHPPKAATTS